MSDASCTLLDLRRTTTMVAGCLTVSMFANKRQANHKFSNDVRDVYIVSDIDLLRNLMLRITDALLGRTN